MKHYKYQPCAECFSGFDPSFTQVIRVLGIISSAFYREGSSGIERVAGHHEAAGQVGPGFDLRWADHRLPPLIRRCYRPSARLQLW